MMYGRPPHPGPPKQWRVYNMFCFLVKKCDLVWSNSTFQELIEIATFALPVAIFYVFTMDINNWPSLAPFKVDINYSCDWHKDDSKVKILSCCPKSLPLSSLIPLIRQTFHQTQDYLALVAVNLLRSVCNDWTPESLIAFWLRFRDF